MAAQPIPPQTQPPTRPNPPAARTTPNTTTASHNASKASSPPSKNQAPSSQQTITIDASTRIMGHANTIGLPSNNLTNADNIESILRAALPHIKPTTSQASKPVNITIQTGISVMGSRNIVVLGSDAATKDSVKAQQAGKETDAMRDAGRKRRAESEPVVESRRGGGGKKVKVEKEC